MKRDLAVTLARPGARRSGGRSFRVPAAVLSAAAGLVLAANGLCAAELGDMQLDCKLGYDAHLQQVSARQDLQKRATAEEIEFRRGDADGVTYVYVFTQQGDGAHPAVFGGRIKPSCDPVEASGCSFGNTHKFNVSLESLRATPRLVCETGPKF